ncbi:KTSC domain-containing protein [Lysobacter sp. GCM10012299]|uniref:KTSC domain-containing protein n=1 Tax=Lysobacter sp. GCM10012299 TaxID=3317333 RepID=UPI003608FDFD
MRTIDMQDANSSQIHSIGHDAETNTLAIRFFRGFGRDQLAGPLYHYANFTVADFEAFKGAESLGRHFGTHIKPFADRHPFTRIDEETVSDTTFHAVMEQMEAQ